MNNFNYINTARILFGKDTENQVGQALKPYGKKVLLHMGGKSVKASGLYDRVIHSLDEAGIEVIELSGVVPNPRYSMVLQGIELCRKHKIDMILAVGGGSVIDSAKAIAFGVLTKDDPWSYFMGGKTVTKALPIGVILTLPAAGSETSDSCVITNEIGGYKRSAGGEVLIPRFAIINPVLHMSLPPYQSACGITDMAAHLMERYFSPTRHTDLTDRLIEASLKTILVQGIKVMKNPHNYDARAEIALAGTLAHNNLFGVGRIGDWASHTIEHELSAKYDIAHGAGLAIIFPAWMKYVYKTDTARFVMFASRVFGLEMDEHDPEEIALAGIFRLEDFFKSLGLDITFENLSVSEEDIMEMASKIYDQSSSTTIGQFQKLTRDDVVEILHLAK